MVLAHIKRVNRAIILGVFGLVAAAVATSNPTTAQAEIVEGSTNLDWYIFVGRNANDSPIVVYFQSDSTSEAFEPVGSVAMVVRSDYVQTGRFDPAQACAVSSLEFEPESAKKLRTQIIYGPNSGRGTVSIIDLPSFMAQQTAVALMQEGVVIDQAATVPYFNCAGFVWAELLSQPEEVWQRIAEEQLNAQ